MLMVFGGADWDYTPATSSMGSTLSGTSTRPIIFLRQKVWGEDPQAVA